MDFITNYPHQKNQPPETSTIAFLSSWAGHAGICQFWIRTRCLPTNRRRSRQSQNNPHQRPTTESTRRSANRTWIFQNQNDHLRKQQTCLSWYAYAIPISSLPSCYIWYDIYQTSDKARLPYLAIRIDIRRSCAFWSARFHLIAQ